MHFTTLHGFHCIQSQCMDSTAFSDAAWNQLHSIGIHLATLHGIHCVQSGCISPRCMEYTAFNHAAWNPRHSIGMHWDSRHGLHCIQSHCMESTPLNRDVWAMLYKIHCINRDAFGLAAWTPLHTIVIHCATMNGILCIQ